MRKGIRKGKRKREGRGLLEEKIKIISAYFLIYHYYTAL
jgi:hypothetical protein